MVFHIIIIIVAIVGIFIGFRKGMIHQIATILGILFGIVTCRIFHDQVVEFLQKTFPSIAETTSAEFSYSVIASALIFAVVYLVFLMLAKVIRSAVKMVNIGMLDSLAGAVIGALKYLLVLSLAMNLLVAMNPNSNIIKLCDDDDGNLVELVMALAPAMLNSEDVEDFCLKLQLEEAKTISYNNTLYPNAIRDNAITI